MVVPSGAPAEVCRMSSPPWIMTCVASGFFEPRSFEVNVTLETAAILASASPRKPRVIIPAKSFGSVILLVAC